MIRLPDHTYIFILCVKPVVYAWAFCLSLAYQHITITRCDIDLLTLFEASWAVFGVVSTLTSWALDPRGISWSGCWGVAWGTNRGIRLRTAGACHGTTQTNNLQGTGYLRDLPNNKSACASTKQVSERSVPGLTSLNCWTA